MREISLHILDIAENSVNAGASKIRIDIVENLNKDQLTIHIQDDGKGMDADMVRKITDPFVTSRTTRNVGLGIPFLKAAAEACQGGFEIESQPGKGTKIGVNFQHSHIDRMPLGDIKNTFLNLVIGYPGTHWIFSYQVNGNKYIFDSKPIKDILGDIPLSDPAVITYLKNELTQGIGNLS